MKKNSQRTKIPLDIQMKKNPLSPFIFWSFVDCVNSASSLPKTNNFIPNEGLGFVTQTFDEISICNLAAQRKVFLNNIKSGSLVACVLASTPQHYFPIHKKMAEIPFTKIRTFFGHVMQQRNKVNNFSSLLLRVLIAGEFFLFRIFLYAPNVLSFFSLGIFNKNYRSSFLFKTRKAQKALQRSRRINS